MRCALLLLLISTPLARSSTLPPRPATMVHFGLLLSMLCGTQGTAGSGFTSITVSSSAGRGRDTGHQFSKVSSLEFERIK